MENQIKKKEETQSLGLSPKNKTKELCQSLVHINQLTSFCYSDIQIKDWVKSIEELTPEITPKTIKKIMDKMKIGLIKYDHRLGIQNIFNGYKIVLEDYLTHLCVFKNKYHDYYQEKDPEEIKKIDEEISKISELKNKITKTEKAPSWR